MSEFEDLHAFAVVSYGHDVFRAGGEESFCAFRSFLAVAEAIHADAGAVAFGIVGFECHGPLPIGVGDGDVFSRFRTALSEGLCVVEGHLVAEVLDVVGVDVVQSGRSLGIAFGVDVAAEFVNLFLGDDVPSRTVVLNVGVDGAQESGLLEEVETRKPGTPSRIPCKYRFNRDRYMEMKAKGFRLKF